MEDATKAPATAQRAAKQQPQLAAAVQPPVAPPAAPEPTAAGQTGNQKGSLAAAVGAPLCTCFNTSERVTGLAALH